MESVEKKEEGVEGDGGLGQKFETLLLISKPFYVQLNIKLFLHFAGGATGVLSLIRWLRRRSWKKRGKLRSHHRRRLFHCMHERGTVASAGVRLEKNSPITG